MKRSDTKKCFAFEPLEDRRLLAGNIIVAAGGGGPLILTELIDIHVDQGVLTVRGTSQRDNIQINYDSGANLYTATVQHYKSGLGWTTVKEKSFSGGQISSIDVASKGANDQISNNTGLRMNAFGGDGNDRIYGGSNDDVLLGGDGNDIIIGWGGMTPFPAMTETISCTVRTVRT